MWRKPSAGILMRAVSALGRPSRLAVWTWMVLSCVLLPASRAYGTSASLTPPSATPAPIADIVSVRTVWSVDRARPGDRLALAVVLEVAAGYHINADIRQIKPLGGFKPYPTRVTVAEASPGLVFETPRYPSAHSVAVEFTPDPLMVFDGRTIVTLPVALGKNFSSENVQVTLSVAYQACDNQVCLFPVQIQAGAELPVAAAGDIVQAIHQDLFAGQGQRAVGDAARAVEFSLFGWHFAIDTTTAGGFILLLLTAALGGLLLNFTPCVLPLVPIKIMSLSMAAQSYHKCLALGGAMFLGILGFWTGLGAVIATISGFTAINQLFQFPVFTILIGIVIGVMGLGMWRAFVVQLPNFLYAFNPRQDTLTGSFGLGILTAVLSTPCTAPFMGAAAAWAATRPPLTTLTTFAAIGSGMALPYLLLSASPGLAQQIPSSGPASVVIKQMMGLLMLAVAAYFVGSGASALLAAPASPPAKGYWWVVMGFIALSGLWLAYQTIRIASGKFRRTLFVALGVLLFAGGVYGGVRLTDRGPIDWIYYTPQRWEQALERRNIVVMVFSAEWCLNCKALEQGVLNDAAVVEQMRRADVAPIKVDITGNNPDGKARLAAIGQLTIPLLVVYSPTGREVFRSDFYTADQVVAAIRTAGAEN
ncbi:MAG: cytochrome c biogenesis protein CcdA [Desulfobacterales bacterium]